MQSTPRSGTIYTIDTPLIFFAKILVLAKASGQPINVAAYTPDYVRQEQVMTQQDINLYFMKERQDYVDRQMQDKADDLMDAAQTWEKRHAFYHHPLQPTLKQHFRQLDRSMRPKLDEYLQAVRDEVNAITTPVFQQESLIPEIQQHIHSGSVISINPEIRRNRAISMAYAALQSGSAAILTTMEPDDPRLLGQQILHFKLPGNMYWPVPEDRYPTLD